MQDNMVVIEPFSIQQISWRSLNTILTFIQRHLDVANMSFSTLFYI